MLNRKKAAHICGLKTYTVYANELSSQYGFDPNEPFISQDDIDLLNGVICGGYDKTLDSYDDAVFNLRMLRSDARIYSDDPAFLREIDRLCKDALDYFWGEL